MNRVASQELAMQKITQVDNLVFFSLVFYMKMIVTCLQTGNITLRNVHVHHWQLWFRDDTISRIQSMIMNFINESMRYFASRGTFRRHFWSDDQLSSTRCHTRRTLGAGRSVGGLVCCRTMETAGALQLVLCRPTVLLIVFCCCCNPPPASSRYRSSRLQTHT